MTDESIHHNDDQNDDMPDLENFKLTPENFPDTETTLLYFIQTVANNAYIYLGLIPIPGTSETIFKIDEAKRAIDLLEILITHVKTSVPDQVKKELDSALTQLRLNYVSKRDKNQDSSQNND